MQAVKSISTSLFLPSKFVTTTSGKSDQIARLARELGKNEGTLCKKKDFVYLKLDESYAGTLFDKLKEIDPLIRPCKKLYGIGPHISVIRHNEWKGIPPKEISELARRYLFQPLRLEKVQTGKKRLWVLVVEPSKELAKIRKNFGLSEGPYGHPFHITIAETDIPILYKVLRHIRDACNRIL